ncbi:unnamed protein product [Rodentolepis nana]|uniref:Uncharacterized protein n=1 Tax=Rodentolepis nana TaxID=102285 RepID=A0A3P7SXH1_RODNA|nr:unnamed protein product [Rodentolepis nana]
MTVDLMMIFFSLLDKLTLDLQSLMYGYFANPAQTFLLSVIPRLIGKIPSTLISSLTVFVSVIFIQFVYVVTLGICTPIGPWTQKGLKKLLSILISSFQ